MAQPPVHGTCIEPSPRVHIRTIIIRTSRFSFSPNATTGNSPRNAPCNTSSMGFCCNVSYLRNYSTMLPGQNQMHNCRMLYTSIKPVNTTLFCGVTILQRIFPVTGYLPSTSSRPGLCRQAPVVFFLCTKCSTAKVSLVPGMAEYCSTSRIPVQNDCCTRR